MMIPLSGLRVIEYNAGIAAATAGLLLRDAGADVIKIEPPGGDTSRLDPGHRAWNRGKTSVVFEEGDARAAKLAATADVVILGGGTVGNNAAHTAVGIGADVTILDKSLPVLRHLDEIYGGRVKTLHPAIHAGILADMTNPEHAKQLEEFGIKPFDLVVVNLYPFAATIAQPGCATKART